MINYLPPILERVREAGHKVFTNGHHNLNIVGIRSPSRVANSFDDLLTVTFKTQSGVWQTRYYQPFTTDPGTYWLTDEGTRATAILCPGQYSSYKLDKHRGSYLALCQRVGPVRVYRDGNKDNVLDLEPGSITEGYFGINLHRATTSTSHPSTQVNKWSAGCSVVADPKQFDDLIDLCKAQITYRGWETFTYTLLEL